jgi:formamidopyrimidine-DNA glycosylase
VPELPDIRNYVEALRRFVLGQTLEDIRVRSPFLVRSLDPPIESFPGRRVLEVGNLGKQIVIEFEDAFYLVLHLMIAGRLRWRKKGAALPGRAGLAAFDFSNGTLALTEAGSKRRAALHAVAGKAGLRAYDRGGLDVLSCSANEFGHRLRRENHTVKRALCDPSNFAGIGNAYSDEILHAAGMSPFKLTGSLEPAEIERLLEAARSTLQAWIERLRAETGEGFPEKVTAFRAGMAVHGRYRQPCPVCETPVQRIVYAENEANYCPRCQTGGKVLRDRALSRLLREDWPRSIDAWEERLKGGPGNGA